MVDMTDLALFVLLTLGSTSSPRLDGIDDLVREAMKAWNVPGTSVVIVTPGKSLHLQGYGLRKVVRQGSRNARYHLSARIVLQGVHDHIDRGTCGRRKAEVG